jgi:hypothetical protein
MLLQKIATTLEFDQNELFTRPNCKQSLMFCLLSLICVPLFVQVGIVALNLLGEPVPEGRGAPTSSRTSHPTSRYPQSDLALDMGVDSKTATVIRELHAKKEAAVANEDYDEAKQLKAAIDRLRSVGQKIGQLEAKKAAAVEVCAWPFRVKRS